MQAESFALGSASIRPLRLIHGNSLLKSTLKPESVDLIVTSPPYNVGKAYNGSAKEDTIAYNPHYLNFTKKWLSNCYHWTKPTGRLCVNVALDKNKCGKAPLSADVTRLAMEVGWLYHATLIWNENNISRRTAWGSWMSASAPHIIAPVETVIVLYKEEWKRQRPGENDITAEEFKEWVLGTWTFNGESGKRIGHEAPFPRELPKRCIKLFSFKGDTVLDPFLGSGTTMIEAFLNGREAIGIEKEKKYCELTKQRMDTECKVKFKKSPPAKVSKYISNSWEVLAGPIPTSLLKSQKFCQAEKVMPITKGKMIHSLKGVSYV